MGLFAEETQTPTSRNPKRTDSGKDTLFDWLVRKAEADLGLVQAFAVCETQRTDQIKHLEGTLVAQISELQRQIIESRETDLNDFKSEMVVFSDRIAQIETAKTTPVATREFVTEELGKLKARVIDCHKGLETKYSSFETLGETLTEQIRALEEQIREKLEGLRAAQGDLRHFRSESQSLTERIGQAESANWQTRTLAARNTQQIEQTAKTLSHEISEIKTYLSEHQEHSHVPELLINEIAQTLKPKVEEIENRLTQEHKGRMAHDARLDELDSDLMAFARRLVQTESLSLKTNESLQRTTQSTSDFRTKIDHELAGIQSKLDETQARESVIQNLEASLRLKLEDWQNQVTQKLMLLENRDSERDKSAKQLHAMLAAGLAKQDERVDERLSRFASVHEELLHLKPTFEKLAQRMAQVESATQSVQAQANSALQHVVQMGSDLRSDLDAVKKTLNEEQSNLRLFDERTQEIERMLGPAINELHRQMAMDREGIEHWERGLRETLGAELSAMQGRLTERQSQIEHRYLHLDRFEEMITAKLQEMEAKLYERLNPGDHDREQWTKLQSELDLLCERTFKLESQALESQQLATVQCQKIEATEINLREELNAIVVNLDARPTAPADEMFRQLEDSFGAKLQRLQEDITRRLTLCDARDRQSEQAFTDQKADLEILKTAIEQYAPAPSKMEMSSAIEKSVHAAINDYDKKLAERFGLVGTCDAERTQQTEKTIEALRDDLTALQSSVSRLPPFPAEDHIYSVEQSLGAKLRELERQMEQKIGLLETRDTERTQRAEQVVTGLRAELAAIQTNNGQNPGDSISSDPALSGLEENLSAKMKELHQQVAQNCSLFESRDAEIQELKERSQSLSQRVAQLSAAVQATQKMEPKAISPLPARTEAGFNKTSNAHPDGHNLPIFNSTNEKEQLKILQERMSTEIERVRAELKERSGRWKVRKTAS